MKKWNYNIGNSCLLIIVNPLVPKHDCSCAVGAEKAEPIYMQSKVQAI